MKFGLRTTLLLDLWKTHWHRHTTELFTLLDYNREDTYRFDDKSLDACWLSPSDATGHSSEASPKIFISELDLSSFDSSFTEIVKKYVDSATGHPFQNFENSSLSSKQVNASWVMK